MWNQYYLNVPEKRNTAIIARSLTKRHMPVKPCGSHTTLGVFLEMDGRSNAPVLFPVFTYGSIVCCVSLKVNM